MILSGKYGRFLNAAEGEGFEINKVGRRGRLFPQIIYEFVLDPETPLVWHDNDGYFYQFDHKFNTNLGSTPALTRAFLPQAQFPISYSGHDSCWIHHGIWRCAELEGEYKFIPISRWKSNTFLFRWVDAEGGKIRKGLIWLGVSIGAIAVGLWEVLKNATRK